MLHHSEEKEEYDATGRAAYQHCCKMLGIIPISHLLADLENNVTHINLSHHGLGAKGAKSIAAALAVSLSSLYSVIDSVIDS